MEQVLAGTFAPGGDLMIREKASASALEHNITASITQGVGDVADPAVSYDGRKIVFAMNCPGSNTSKVNGVPACTGAWNIWEYDMTVGGLTGGTFRRLTNSGADDVGPAYLPSGGGFVFTSNRQATSSQNQFAGHAYRASDEYEGQTTFNLHTMDANGGNVTQISFNQSHDRNPVVRPNGDIMFSRWEHVGGANQFKVFTVKPDGTNMFVLYGEHSPGESFSHPQDMDPNGKHAGFISTESEAIEGGGGGLLYIDAAHYSEQNTPANSTIPATGGQAEATTIPMITDGLAVHGRLTTPYPLWDGSDRFLVAFQPCQVKNNGVVVSCSTLAAADIARLDDGSRLTAAIASDPLQTKVPPAFAIYMFDPVLQTFLIVAAPPPGFMNVSPVALQARTEPVTSPPTSVDTALSAQGLGLLDIRSIYDTDGLGRMGDPVISAHDLARCRMHDRDREDDAERPARHACDGGRPGEDQGPGEPRVPVRTRPLPAHRARNRSGLRRDRHRAVARRHAVRIAADHRLRADRARRLGEGAGAGRHADRCAGDRLGRPRVPDPHQLDPGPARRASYLRRLPQPAARRRAQRRRGRRDDAGRAQPDAGRARTSPAKRWPIRARVSTRRCSCRRRTSSRPTSGRTRRRPASARARR